MLMLGQPKKVTENWPRPTDHGGGEGRRDDPWVRGLSDTETEDGGRCLPLRHQWQNRVWPALLERARLKATAAIFQVLWPQLDAAIEKQPKLYEAWQLKVRSVCRPGDSQAALATYHQGRVEIKPDYLAARAIVRNLLAENKLDRAGKGKSTRSTVCSQSSADTVSRASLSYQQKDYPAARGAICHLKVLPESPLGLQLAGLIEYRRAPYSQAGPICSRRCRGLRRWVSRGAR